MPEKDEFKTLDEFLLMYAKKTPDTVFLVKNNEKYAAIEKAMNTITGFFNESDSSARFEIRYGKMDPTALYFIAVANEVIVHNIKEYAAAMSEASNFEIYRLKGNKIIMSFLFNNAYSLAPPSNNK
ncbi:MAG: hypothetical protein FWD58_08850 [Firmicutes bacterium]|nr:hypothetical protein [Bacillota bacterium]